MTGLLARVQRLGVPVAAIAAQASITRGALSNAMYGRRRLSSAASGRVELVLRRLETDHEAAEEAQRIAADLSLGRAVRRAIGA